jgi:teichuronic acid biosynthesis glycosyltransferase TuaC
MKVLVYTSLYPNSAQPQHGIFIENRVRELRKRTGWKFEVVAPVPWWPRSLAGNRRYGVFAKVPKEETRDGLRVHHPRFPMVPGISWRVAPWLIFWATLPLLRRLKESGFDIIDAHFLFPDGVAAVMLGRKLECPVTMTARGSDINDSPRFLLPRLLLKWAIRRADKTMAVSEGLADGVRNLVGEVTEVPVVPNGVDASVFFPRDRERSRQQLGIEGPTILTVGSLRKLKGHHLLINALVELPRVTLLICGAGEERGALEALAARLGVAHRTRFLGPLSNFQLPEYYSACDVFVLASEMEGCPNVVLEALACGSRVVASAVGAIPEMLGSEGLENLVYERTPRAFAEKIRAALGDSKEEEISRNDDSRFNWVKTSETISAVLLTEVEAR